jgi:signal transduction histidine kinase
MIIANKVFGVVYCKLNETKDQNIILITISFLIHINLKLRICELQMFTEELKQINQSKDTFLSLISHEMRTPLTIILPSLSTLSDLVQEFESEEDKEMFNYILDGMIVSSNRLHKIVEEIIMYISLSSHSMPSEVIEVAPTYICQEYFDHKREKIESEGIEYTTSYVEDVTEYDLDLNLFNKGLDIILSNAIKFKGNNPFIKVTTTCGENYYEVEIADNGIGMTEEEVDKVFQSFEMVEDIEHHQEGLGINLSIAQLIFETYHKGKLEVISKKGEGTQVKIKIFKN